jgi:hypothetical protein
MYGIAKIDAENGHGGRSGVRPAARRRLVVPRVLNIHENQSWQATAHPTPAAQQSERVIKMKRFMLTGAAIFAAMIFSAAGAMCATVTWDGGAATNNWNDANNWSNDTLPTSADDVVLPGNSGTPYDIDMDATAGTGGNEGYARTLSIHSDARLDIEAGKILEIGNADGQSSTVDGSIALEGSGSVLRFVYSHSVSSNGNGFIDGNNDAARIDIGDDSDPNNTTLTSTVTISGGLQVVSGPSSTGTMTFVNNGVVEANNGSQILQINPDVVAGSGEWKVTATDAELNFVTGSTSLTGAVTINADGTLDIDDHVETTASLTFSNGDIEVAANKRFVANK